MAVTGNYNYGNARSPLLNPNHILGSVFNMIISQTVYTDNIKGTYHELVDKFRLDGSLYGDTKLWYASDILESEDWIQDDAGELNVLAIKRPDSPKCQYVQIDQFRKVWITVDSYRSKAAWSNAGVFQQFTSQTLAWLEDTRKVYESRLINCYIGKTKSAADRGTIKVNLDDTTSGDPLYGITGEEKNRMEASLIGQALADLMVDLKDTTRDFNDYGFMRSYALEDLMFVWNAAWVNKIRKVDLPSLFHQQGVVDNLDEYTLPARYFGRTVTASDAGSGKVIKTDGTIDPTKGTLRSDVEITVTISSHDYHLFPGDDIVATITSIGNKRSAGQGTTDAAAVTVGSSSTDFLYSQVYLEESTCICKIMHKQAVPFMSAFSIQTSFWNARNLSENQYLIWGFSAPCYLYNRPFLTIEKK